MSSGDSAKELLVLDAHIHLCCQELSNAWADADLAASARHLHPEKSITCRPRAHWSEAKFLAAAEEAETCIEGRRMRVPEAIFVECGNQPFLDEARWALSLAADESSRVAAVVAHVPVPEGAAAVAEFLSSLRDSSGKLPLGLKGGRVVLLGTPMPAPDSCLAKDYMEGLQVLGEAGLHWEWCCHWEALQHIAVVCEKVPHMSFVLDHVGRNCGEPHDFQPWADAISSLARTCPNVVAKLGAIEEWGCLRGDPSPYLEHAIRSFGFHRVLFESNWFVSEACGFDYSRTLREVWTVCQGLGANEAELAAVFRGNAKRVYRLS